MSLYNMLFGVAPASGIALKMLGVEPGDVPRFRDAYFAWADKDAKSDPVIVVHTRTGGGNRPHYDSPESYRNEEGEDGTGPWNSDLQALPGYRHDCDDDFDCTYANFFFSVPDTERDAVVAFLSQSGQPSTMQEKFER